MTTGWFEAINACSKSVLLIFHTAINRIVVITIKYMYRILEVTDANNESNFYIQELNQASPIAKIFGAKDKWEYKRELLLGGFGPCIKFKTLKDAQFYINSRITTTKIHYENSI